MILGYKTLFTLVNLIMAVIWYFVGERQIQKHF